MGIFSGWHLFIILMIVLVVFGAGKLPNVMKDIGRGVKSFKEAMNEKEPEGAAPPAQAQAQAQAQATLENDAKNTNT